MSEHYEIQTTICDPNACIICGQKHDKTFLKPPPDLTLQKTNKLSTGIALVIVISIVVGFGSIFVSGYMQRIRMEDRMMSEMNTIVRLQTIARAEESFRQSHKRYGTIDELVSTAGLRKKWIVPVRDGYYFSVKLSGDSIAISALPTNYNDDDHRRSFISYIDGDGKNESSVIYGADNGGAEPGRSDELIGKSLEK